MRYYFFHTNKIKGQQYNCKYYEILTDTSLINLCDLVEISIYVVC